MLNTHCPAVFTAIVSVLKWKKEKEGLIHTRVWVATWILCSGVEWYIQRKLTNSTWKSFLLWYHFLIFWRYSVIFWECSNSLLGFTVIRMKIFRMDFFLLIHYNVFRREATNGYYLSPLIIMELFFGLRRIFLVVKS